MPSKTAKQHRFMAYSCTHPNGKIPQSVACEFMHADKGRKVAKNPRKKKRGVK